MVIKILQCRAIHFRVIKRIQKGRLIVSLLTLDGFEMVSRSSTWSEPKLLRLSSQFPVAPEPTTLSNSISAMISESRYVPRAPHTASSPRLRCNMIVFPPKASPLTCVHVMKLPYDPFKTPKTPPPDLIYSFTRLPHNPRLLARLFPLQKIQLSAPQPIHLTQVIKRKTHTLPPSTTSLSN